MDNPAGRDSDEIVIPVIAEQLHVDTIAVPSGGVRVVKRTVTENQLIEAQLREQHAEIKRVSINREVEGPLPIRETENGVIVSVVEEELIIQRRWILREELHLIRTESVREYREAVPVSHDEVSIERLDR